MVHLLRIDSPQRALPRRHRGAAREGVFRRALDGGRDLSLDRLEAGRRPAGRLSGLPLQPHPGAPPPLLKKPGGGTPPPPPPPARRGAPPPGRVRRAEPGGPPPPAAAG